MIKSKNRVSPIQENNAIVFMLAFLKDTRHKLDKEFIRKLQKRQSKNEKEINKQLYRKKANYNCKIFCFTCKDKTVCPNYYEM